MRFEELYFIIHSDTDVDVVKKGYKTCKICRGTYHEDVPYEIRIAEVDYLTAVDYRTVEVGLKKREVPE